MADKITLHDLQALRERGEPITMLTAYDYPSALLVDAAGIDMILVGDSLGMVVHGLPTTLPVTLDMMILHSLAVMRAVEYAFVVGDMPFGTFQISVEEAKRSAARFVAEAAVDAVKLEGGQTMAETVRAIVSMGVAVQGHIGLTPQSVGAFGGMKVQGKDVDRARQLVRDAIALEEAGAFSIVLEAVPARLADLITRTISIPTIGIGAGAGCSGQVLVMHDLLNLFDRFTPKFVKKYGNISAAMTDAFIQYRDEVRGGQFPAAEHTFSIHDDVMGALEDEFGG
jgi:3-methyl-2-oxobutanoate hydroxymethyltransferase